MLGHKLVQIWQDKFDLWTTIRTEYKDYEKFGIFDRDKTIELINIEDQTSIETAIKILKPNVIINAVGIIKQLPSARNVIKTLSVNSIFPHRLSEISNRVGSRLITISTDCVFSGKTGGYVESDFSDAPDLYGKSKFLGEIADENCLTIRTSIIGRELNTAHGLIEWFLSNEGKSVKGFQRAVFSGFPTIVLADILADLIENHPKLHGLYHVSCEPINKFDLLTLVKEAYQADIEIMPSDELLIDRSLDSTKFREATGFKSIDWTKMIEVMAADNAPYQNK